MIRMTVVIAMTLSLWGFNSSEAQEIRLRYVKSISKSIPAINKDENNPIHEGCRANTRMTTCEDKNKVKLLKALGGFDVSHFLATVINYSYQKKFGKELDKNLIVTIKSMKVPGHRVSVIRGDNRGADSDTGVSQERIVMTVKVLDQENNLLKDFKVTAFKSSVYTKSYKKYGFQYDFPKNAFKPSVVPVLSAAAFKIVEGIDS